MKRLQALCKRISLCHQPACKRKSHSSLPLTLPPEDVVSVSKHLNQFLEEQAGLGARGGGLGGVMF